MGEQEEKRNWVWGPTSLAVRAGLCEQLQSLCDLALTFSEYDFRLVGGFRTDAEQRANVAKGASQIQRSKHQDRLAVDVLAVKDPNGLLPYVRIAESFGRAAERLSIQVKWGGCWAYVEGKTSGEIAEMLQMYTERKRRAGERPFLDLGHFELKATLIAGRWRYAP